MILKNAKGKTISAMETENNLEEILAMYKDYDDVQYTEIPLDDYYTNYGYHVYAIDFVTDCGDAFNDFWASHCERC